MLSMDIRSIGIGAIVGGNVDMSATGPISLLVKKPARRSEADVDAWPLD